MKWLEVRKLYPEQFVKVQILATRVEADRVFVDEMEVIEPISDSEATRELLASRNETLVYHTSHEQMELVLRNRQGGLNQ